MPYFFRALATVLHMCVELPVHVVHNHDVAGYVGLVKWMLGNAATAVEREATAARALTLIAQTARVSYEKTLRYGGCHVTCAVSTQGRRGRGRDVLDCGNRVSQLRGLSFLVAGAELQATVHAP
jgi:hypothetical protein